MKNAYAKKVYAMNDALLKIGCEFGAQKIIDMLTIVLNDSEVMGNDTFGSERIKRVVIAIMEYAKLYEPAWENVAETDYYRAKMDERIKKIVGDNFTQFEKRYTYLKETKY